MKAMVYVVSDLAKGYDKLKTPYWRPTGMFSSIVAAKKWANYNSSIITQHTLCEARKVMDLRQLPETYEVIA
jgi:hypothetical protein